MFDSLAGMGRGAWGRGWGPRRWGRSAGLSPEGAGPGLRLGKAG